jgi:nucleoside-diphosphate-sugar epimerase
MENPGSALKADIHEVCSDDSIPWDELRGGDTRHPSMTADDARVFAQFARNALAGENFELHTEGRSRGYAPDVAYTLKADKLEALGWKPKHGLGEMSRGMLADWRGR